MQRTPAAGLPRTLSVIAVVTGLILTMLGSPWTLVTAQTPPAPVGTPPPMDPPPADAPPPVSGPTAFPTPAPLAALPETREQQLATELLANEQGVYGYVVMEADGTLVASINGQTPFVTASLYKLILMADIYQRIEMGYLSKDDLLVFKATTFLDGSDNYFDVSQIGTSFTVQEYLYAVGAYSSNVAARTLLELTSREALRNTAMAIGMMHTYLFYDPLLIPNWPTQPGIDAPPEEFALAQEYLRGWATKGPVNITTPHDMAKYAIAIANDTLLSPWVSEQVANVLMEQAIRDRIPALLDGEVFTINKPGNLPDAVNDVGVIYLPSGPRAVAILALGVYNTARATEVEQRLAVIATGWARSHPDVAPWREDA